MVKRVGVTLCALMLAFAVAHAAPFINGNTPQQGRTWAYCDSVAMTPAKVFPEDSKGLYLIEGVTTSGQQDSIVTTWHNGGAVPKFRRIQGMRIFAETTSLQYFYLTFFHSDGTSARNIIACSNEMPLSFPVEADSIRMTSFGSLVGCDICICRW